MSGLLPFTASTHPAIKHVPSATASTVQTPLLRMRLTLQVLRVFLLSFALLATIPNHANLYEDRLLYKRAVNALQSGKLSQFDGMLTQLGTYPLVPYLEYRRLLKSVNRASIEQALAYKEHAEPFTFGDRYMSVWLAQQAISGRWANYVEHYKPTPSDIIAQCRYALGLIRTGNKAQAYALLAELWNVGESQHKSCDPAFQLWIRDRGITPTLAWSRLQKALDEGSYSLSRYTMRFLTQQMKPSAQAMYDVRRNTRLARNPSRFRNDQWGNDAWLYGLNRLARNDANEALKIWQTHHPSRNISPEQRKYFLDDLYLWLGLDGFTRLEHVDGLSPSSLARVIHAHISNGLWVDADRWINELPESELSTFEWRFWRTRVNQNLGRDGWQQEMQALAQERTYYGFLASQTLGIAPQLNEKQYVSQPELEAKLANSRHAQMIFEFFAVGEPDNGRKEWRKFEQSLTDEEKMVMIQWFNERGLANEAIWAANRGEMLNFLEVRFPTPFLSYFKQGAFTANVPLHFLLALSRQESAFDHRAISHAGARGLMQMMLPTARATARNNQISQPSATTLLDPRKNIELGSYHVAELAAQYNSNRILIAASYNAGKHRVEDWLQRFPVNDAVAFIEVIPFRETREYVKGVLAFSLVYALRSGQPAHLFEAHEFALPQRTRN